jgi:hypothetical protein
LVAVPPPSTKLGLFSQHERNSSFSVVRCIGSDDDWGCSLRHYRCYFLIDDRIKAAEDIGARDDADALLRAEELLAGSSFPAIEVWQAARLVGRLAVAHDLTAVDKGKTQDPSPRPQ